MHASMQHSTKSLNLIKFKVFVSLSAATIIYTIKINVGSNVHLPCHFPPSSQVSANALWFKEMGAGVTTSLTLGDSSTSDDAKVEQLYPMDHDQSIILRHTAMEDAGTYHCQSAEGDKLSTVNIIVEGRFGNLFYILLYYKFHAI